MAITSLPAPYFLILLMMTLISASVNLAAFKDDVKNNIVNVKIRSHEELVSMHESWMVEHGKTYGATGEKEKRLEIFKDNLKYIEEHNAVPDRSYKLGLTPFADLTNDEFNKMLSSVRPVDPELVKRDEFFEAKVGDSMLPDSIDWREKGAVSPVKDQGRCGSAWAFSALASVESIQQIVSGGDLISLSGQQLVDCSGSYGNNGCDGGDPVKAFDYIIDRGGVAPEYLYPYNASVGFCRDVDKIIVKIGGYRRVPADNETALMKAVANQPVSAWINVGALEFQNYKSGLFNSWCGRRPTQPVNVVGYGDSETGKYWIVKNSWGSKWGENGYIRLRRGVALCGIAQNPTYPTMTP